MALALALGSLAYGAPEEAAPTIAFIAAEDAAVSADLERGLRRALTESREAGGPALTLEVGRPGADWSSAAGPAVRMATSGRALAIVTPPERATAHLLSQLGTRAHVPVFSTSLARSVIQAGSTWVVSVAPPGGEAPAWESVGYDTGRALVEGVRRAGSLSRRGLMTALRTGGPLRGARGWFGFGRLGGRVDVDSRALRLSVWCLTAFRSTPPVVLPGLDW